MFGVFGGGPPLSFGHFSRTAGETLPPVRPVTLTLALSHRGRGDVLLHPPASPARVTSFARAPLRFAKGAVWFIAFRKGLVVRCLV